MLKTKVRKPAKYGSKLHRKRISLSKLSKSRVNPKHHRKKMQMLQKVYEHHEKHLIQHGKPPPRSHTNTKYLKKLSRSLFMR